MKNTILLSILATLLFQHCLSDAPYKKGSKSLPCRQAGIDHEQWTILLQKYVDRDGMADYKGFQKDSINLISYLNELSTNPPDENTWSNEEQIAYWINAYNAFTIKLIIDHYPLNSIKDIGSAIQIPFINSPWDIKFIEINGEKLDLNNIEHSILRKKFNEPRIHFAINCASFSCPKLRREAYSEDKLDVQLNEQAVDFINDPHRNMINGSQAEVSKIFSWFKGDFTKNGSLTDFLNKYAKIKIDEDVKISYIKYDWSLNEISSILK
ncbi:MAG: DUF547 domain-containing protein [Cyclobacteriaceae bacterium]|nr:DUF547 domain-containing protein [Cyclobacteriaceae bacterium]